MNNAIEAVFKRMIQAVTAPPYLLIYPDNKSIVPLKVRISLDWVKINVI